MAVFNETRIVVVSSTARYRQLCAREPQEHESVLEIGCSAGEGTRLLAKHSARVLAVDVSADLPDLSDLPNVTVARMDGRDTDALKALLPSPDLLFIDIGGNALAGNVTTVLRQCLLVFRPRVTVVRSFELAQLHAMIEVNETPESLVFSEPDSIDSLIDLSHGLLAADRVFAAKRLAALGTPEALARLNAMRGDANRQVRWSADKALSGTDRSESSDPHESS